MYSDAINFIQVTLNVVIINIGYQSEFLMYSDVSRLLLSSTISATPLTILQIIVF